MAVGAGMRTRAAWGSLAIPSITAAKAEQRSGRCAYCDSPISRPRKDSVTCGAVPCVMAYHRDYDRDWRRARRAEAARKR